MSTAAWPFLVGRNQTLGYQVVVSPQFMSEMAASYILAQVTGGDESPPGSVMAREIRIRGVGKISVIFRVVRPQAEEYDVGGTDVLRDVGGRPIRLFEGLVVQNGLEQIKEITLTEEDLQMAHDQVKEAYRLFWSADESFTERESVPFNLKAPASAHDQLLLKVDNPLEVSRPSGAGRIARPSMRKGFARKLQVMIAVGLIVLVLVAVLIIYLHFVLRGSAFP